MIWLGLLIAVCSIPGYTGGTVPTQWAVLSAALPLTLWRKGEMTFLHWVGVAFLAYAFLSLAWTANFDDGIWGLWLLSIAALSFWFGSTIRDPRGIYIGLALGLTISSAISIVQYFGYVPVLKGEGYPGLLFNPMIHGITLSMVVVALLTERLWWYIPGLLPGIILSGSRGAWLALLVGAALVLYRKPVLILMALVAVYAFTLGHHHTDIDRMRDWSVAFNNLTFFGHGPGSFLSIYFLDPAGPFHPEYVHNDYLQIVYEYGIASVLLFTVILLALLSFGHDSWPVLVVFALLSLFSFPLYTPITAFLGALAAGQCSQHWYMVWAGSGNSRRDILPWDCIKQYWLDKIGSKDIPFQPGIQNKEQS